MASTTAMARGTSIGNETGLEQRRRDGHGKDKEARKESMKRVYAKEATVTVDLTEVRGAKAEDIIKAVTEKIGVGKILAVRPKQMDNYEVTLEKEEDTEKLMDGLIINGKNCEIQKLKNRDYVVSIMHLPAYLDDEDILKKLEGWGVFPLSKIRRRVYPGTSIEDGTRFVKTRFPKEVISLPYSTKFETEEGPQFFRVMHSHQVKTCRLCTSPDHIVKDCPDNKCYRCGEMGHFARDCKAVKCPDCKEVTNKCVCGMRNEEEEEEEGVSRQVYEGDNEKEQEEGTTITQDATAEKDEGESRGQCNFQGEQEQQEDQVEMQIDMPGVCGLSMDKREQSKSERDGMISESEDEEDQTEKQMKRRRSIKVKPCLAAARKRIVNEDTLRSVNRYELLKDMGETE